jgi:ribosomal protein S18 acetylase RimI-like enzyme
MIDKHAANQPQIITLDESHFPDATKILTAAFRNDPMIAHMFPPQKCNREAAAFFEFLLMKSKLLHESLYGLLYNGELVGMACMELPSSKRPSALQVLAFIHQSLRLVFKIPLRSFVFINEYMKSTSSVRPKSQHHYLIFIGMDPSYQGKGFGKLMLDYLHTLVKSEPASCGIGLDTENPHNVALYERFGYKVTETRVIGPVTIFNMFRSTDN